MGVLEKSLSVVIPAFNEEGRIAAAAEAAAAWGRERGFDVEVLVSDDGSADGTRAAAETAAARHPAVRVLPPAPHLGKGAAVRRGMLAAARAAVLFMDADRSAPVEEVEALWPHLEAGADVVCGSRAVRGSNIMVSQPAARAWFGRLSRGLVRCTGLTPVWDTQCGFKLFRREAARDLFSRSRVDGFAFDLEILGLAAKRGCRVVEAPIRWSNREPSHLSLRRDLAGIAADALRLAWRLRFGAD